MQRYLIWLQPESLFSQSGGWLVRMPSGNEGIVTTLDANAAAPYTLSVAMAYASTVRGTIMLPLTK